MYRLEELFPSPSCISQTVLSQQQKKEMRKKMPSVHTYGAVLVNPSSCTINALVTIATRGGTVLISAHQDQR